MKKSILYFALALTTLNVRAQINLITNGSFEATNPYSNWSSNNNTYWWAAEGACSAHGGTKHTWFGAEDERSGVNYALGDLYQTITIPSALRSCVLGFWASINTNETGTSEEDYTYIKIRNTSGTLLYSLGKLTNLDAAYGIPGCQTWAYYYVSIPSTYFGSTIRISFEFDNDISLSTIFRLDDISLIATLPCTYTISQSTYMCANSSANVYNNISSVVTQSDCNWAATITSGNSWLSSTSSGIGNGNISINVLQNTTSNLRTGTIDVVGQTLTIVQPASGTSVNEISQTKFLVYPNPAHNQITIESTQETIGKSFEIIDNLGKAVIQGKINNLSTIVQLENLSAGVYYLRVKEEGYNLKLIKN